MQTKPVFSGSVVVCFFVLLVCCFYFLFFCLLTWFCVGFASFFVTDLPFSWA